MKVSLKALPPIALPAAALPPEAGAQWLVRRQRQSGGFSKCIEMNIVPGLHSS